MVRQPIDNKIIPMKLSEFITDTVKRIRENIDRRKYNPIFNKWHEPGFQAGEPCWACLGGLDAAARGWVNFDEEISYEEMFSRQKDEDRKNRHLWALDRIRRGHYVMAQKYLGIKKRMSRDLENTIDLPDGASFSDWLEFDNHLASLEEKAKLMAEHGY